MKMAQKKTALDMILNKIKKMTGKKYAKLTDGGNSAIFLSLLICKHINKKKVYIPDMAGWLTYEKYPRLLGFECEKVKTNYGIIENINIEKNSVVLWQNMPGYFAVQNMNLIFEECKKKDSILINDCTADPEKSVGHINVCSFGKNKPINVGYGGFIATDSDEIWALNDALDIINVYPIYEIMLNRIDNYKKKLFSIMKLAEKVKKDLDTFQIVHKAHKGLNVVVKYRNEDEKTKILDYCKKNNYQYTICPRYIRVLDKAISIELKRKLEE